jgi:hypothetical protein
MHFTASNIDRGARPLPATDSPRSRAFRVLLFVGAILLAWGASHIPAQFDMTLDPLRGNRIDPEKLVLLQWLGYVGAALLILWSFCYRYTVALVDVITIRFERYHDARPQRRRGPDGFEIGLAIGFVLLAILLAAHLVIDRQTALLLAEEDGPLEMATALLYLIAAGINVRLAMRFGGVPLTRLALLGLAALFFVVGMEEISWGQRMLGFSTPESMDALNVQAEFNLHNLWSTSLNNAIGLAVTFGLLVVLPLGYRRSPRCRRACDAVGAPVAPITLTWLYLVAVIATCVIGIELGTLGLGPRSLYGLRPHFDDEYLEFFLACLFFIGSLLAWRLKLPLRSARPVTSDAHAAEAIPVP